MIVAVGADLVASRLGEEPESFHADQQLGLGREEHAGARLRGSREDVEPLANHGQSEARVVGHLGDPALRVARSDRFRREGRVDCVRGESGVKGPGDCAQPPQREQDIHGELPHDGGPPGRVLLGGRRLPREEVAKIRQMGHDVRPPVALVRRKAMDHGQRRLQAIAAGIVDGPGQRGSVGEGSARSEELAHLVVEIRPRHQLAEGLEEQRVSVGHRRVRLLGPHAAGHESRRRGQDGKFRRPAEPQCAVTARQRGAARESAQQALAELLVVEGVDDVNLVAVQLDRPQRLLARDRAGSKGERDRVNFGGPRLERDLDQHQGTGRSLASERRGVEHGGGRDAAALARKPPLTREHGGQTRFDEAVQLAPIARCRRALPLASSDVDGQEVGHGPRRRGDHLGSGGEPAAPCARRAGGVTSRAP